MGETNSSRIPLVESGKVSLERLAAKGTLWTVTGYGGQQVLRMATRVYITNQLLPEAVGLMVLVSMWVQGLRMFTDIGLRTSIIQDERGSDPVFLQTAWSIQLIRGVVIFGFVALSGLVMAQSYGHQALIWIMPVAAFEALFEGGITTASLVANRYLQLGRVTMLDLVSTFVGCFVGVVWVVNDPSIWAFVVIPVVRALVRAGLSPFLFPVPRMSLTFERSAARSILRFGSWVFVSSILGFVSGSLDRIILGFYVSIEVLGTYGVAVMWPSAVIGGVQAIGARVLMPMYAFLSDSNRENLTRRVIKLRAALLVPTFIVIFGFTLFGPQFIELLYSEAYGDAGWMLQILAAGAAMSAILATNSPVLLAVGDSYRFMLLLMFGMTAKVVSMVVGGYYFGFTGIVVGVAVADVFVYPVLARFTHRYGVWLPKLDVPLIMIATIVASIAWVYR
jgi:O-antigen/teichoic acid export membrane protein